MCVAGGTGEGEKRGVVGCGGALLNVTDGNTPHKKKPTNLVSFKLETSMMFSDKKEAVRVELMREGGRVREEEQEEEEIMEK